jgi:hypothetical protein
MVLGDLVLIWEQLQCCWQKEVLDLEVPAYVMLLLCAEAGASLDRVLFLFLHARLLFAPHLHSGIRECEHLIRRWAWKRWYVSILRWTGEPRRDNIKTSGQTCTSRLLPVGITPVSLCSFKVLSAVRAYGADKSFSAPCAAPSLVTAVALNGATYLHHGH